MKAFKVFNNNWTCRGFKFRVGDTYTIPEKPILCQKGFHACKKLIDCFNYYPCVPWNKYAEVELLGEVVGVTGDKQCTNKIKILREISFNEIEKHFNRLNGVNKSNGINGSSGVNWSDGINESGGVNESDGVNRSSGVNGSDGINESGGVNGSDGINRSGGVNWSDGINESDGVNRSFAILNCYGISDSLFVINKSGKYLTFNKKVKKARYEEISRKLYSLLNEWRPTFNNLKCLYLKSGSSWKKTSISNAEELSKKEAWVGMPKEAIDYLRALPEFDVEIFTAITGIEIKERV